MTICWMATKKRWCHANRGKETAEPKPERSSELFPTTQFRMAYDRLHQHFTSSRAIKDYLRILQYAARLSESAVDTVLGWLIRGGELPTLGAVEAQLQLSEEPLLEDVHIDEVELTAYDHLLDGDEEEVVPC